MNIKIYLKDMKTFTVAVMACALTETVVILGAQALGFLHV